MENEENRLLLNMPDFTLRSYVFHTNVKYVLPGALTRCVLDVYVVLFYVNNHAGYVEKNSIISRELADGNCY